MKYLSLFAYIFMSLLVLGCSDRLTAINEGSSKTQSTSGRTVLGVVPAAPVTSVGGYPISIQGTGGRIPYSYEVLSGGGVIDQTGSYTAGSSSTMSTVKITDSDGYYTIARVAVNPELKSNFTSDTITVANGDQVRIEGDGGVCPYNFYISSGSGYIQTNALSTINYLQGAVGCNLALYTAPATNSAGVAEVSIVDAMGAVKKVTINYTASTAPPQQNNLAINVINRIVATRRTGSTTPPAVVSLCTVSGGTPPYIFETVTTGLGELDRSTCDFNPPADGANNTSLDPSDIIRSFEFEVKDLTGARRKSYIQVNPVLKAYVLPIAPTFSTNNFGYVPPHSIDFAAMPIDPTANVVAGQKVTIRAKGGLAPFVYHMRSTGVGGLLIPELVAEDNFAQVNTSLVTVTYHAPTTAGTQLIDVIDSAGNIATVTLNVITNANGFNDLSYGTSGITTVDFDVNNDSIPDFTQQEPVDSYKFSDDSQLILVKGTNLVGKTQFALIKVNGNGALVAGFGTNGTQSYTLDAGAYMDEVPASLAVDEANSTVYIGGTCSLNSGSSRMCIIKVDTGTGAQDMTYGAGGIATFDWTATSQVLKKISVFTNAAPAEQRLFVAGQCAKTTGFYFDACFGYLSAAGTVATDKLVAAGSCTTSRCFYSNAATTPNLVAHAYYENSTGEIHLYLNTGNLILRYFNADGSPNVNRPLGGINLLFATVNASDRLFVPAVNFKGATYLSLANSLTASDYAIAKVTRQGLLDNNFGPGNINGLVVQPVAYVTSQVTYGAMDVPTAIRVQSDGKILVMGKSSGFDVWSTSAVRLNPNGGLDLNYGSAGRMLLDIFPTNYPSPLLPPSNEVKTLELATVSGHEDKAMVSGMYFDPVDGRSKIFLKRFYK